MIRSSKAQIIIYLLILLTLNISCSQKKTTATMASSPDISVAKADYKLKYTSGVRAILHDSKGNYWFGSDQEGVCLFDGKTFNYFTIDDGLSNNQIMTIQEDQNGVIWFGTGDGVSSYEEGIIKNRTPKNTFTVEALVKEGWALTKNDLWFDAGNKSGVYRFDGQKLSYLEFPVQGMTNTFNTYSATGFSKGKNGNLWIATYAAVFGYDGKSFEIIDDKLLGYSKESALLHIRSILKDSKENLWIGNNGIGVLLKNEHSVINFSKKMGLIHVDSPGSGAPSPAGTLEHVFAIEEDESGNIWFGDRDTGAWKYDGTNMVNYAPGNGLSSGFVQTIYKDKKGKLWLGLADGSIYQFNGKSFERKHG